MRKFARTLTGGKRVNRKAVLIVAGVAIAAGLGLYGLHRLQTARNADGLLEEADRVERDGRPEQASDFLVQYLGMVPGDTDILARYGLLLSSLAKDNRARERALSTLSRVLMRDEHRPEVRREVARLATRLGHFREAKKDLDHLLRAGTEQDAELLHLYGRCEVGLHQFDEAAKYYGRAAEAAPGKVEISLEYALLLRERLQKPDDADDTIDQMTKRDGRSPRVRLEAARYFLRCGRTDQAREHVRFALDELGPSADLLVLAAEVATARGRMKEARDFLTRGQRLYPQDERMAPRLAMLELRQGAPAKALAHLAPKLDSLPKDPQQLWVLGSLLLDAGAPDRAAAVLQRLRTGPATPLAAILEARLAMRKSAWAEALAALERARSALPVDSELVGQVHLLLAECHGRLGNAEQQLQTARVALQRNPASVSARRMVALALARQGKVDEAILEYRVLAKKAPEVQAELARLLLARNLRLPAEARSWAELDQLLDKAPPGSEIQMLRAESLAARGQVKAARLAMEAECKGDPKQVAPWLFLVRLARQQGPAGAHLALLDEAERQAGPRAAWQLARAEHWRSAAPEQARRELAKLEAGGKGFQGAERDLLLRGLGEVYLQVDDRAAAARLWRELALRQPADVPVRFRLLALAYEDLQAAEVDRLLGEVRPLDGTGGAVTAYGEAARLLLRARQGDKAAFAAAHRHLARAAVLRPTWAAVPRLQGEAHELEGKADKALERYQAALDQGDGRMGTVRRMLKLLVEQKRHAEAQALLGKLPQTLKARTGLARLDVQLSLLTAEAAADQTPEEVRRHSLKAARELVAVGSKDYRDYLWLGQVCVMAGENAAAEKEFRKARDLAADVPETWAPLILLLVQTDPGKAEAELNAARKQLPRARQRLVLAVGYEALGQSAKAEQYYGYLAETEAASPAELEAAASFYERTRQRAKAEPLLRRLLTPALKAPDATVAWARRTLAINLAAGNYGQFKEALTLVPQRPGETAEDRQARALALATRPAHRRDAIRLLEGLPAPSPEARLMLARLYEADGHWPRARTQLLALLAEEDKNPAYLAAYVRGVLRHGRPEEAEAFVEKLAKVAPQALETLDLRVHVLKAQGELEQAAAVARAYAKGKDARLDLAASWLEMVGRGAEAERLYRANAAASKQPETVLLVALHLGRQKKAAEALEVCAKAWATCQPEAVAEVSVAVLRIAGATAAQCQEVERRLKAVIAKQSKKTLLVYLAGLYEQQGRPEALSTYREALAQNESNVAALNNLAYLLALKEGNAAEALDRISRAIDLAGPLAELLDTRAVVYLQKGEPELAVRDLQQAIAQAASPTRYFHLAQAHHRRRNRAAAAEAWAKAGGARLREEAFHPLERPAFRQLSEALH